MTLLFVQFFPPKPKNPEKSRKSPQNSMTSSLPLQNFRWNFSQYSGREAKLGEIYPLKHQALSLPFVFAVTITAIAIFGSFHLEAEQDRTHMCMLFSGHWFTYFFTTLFGKNFCLFLYNFFVFFEFSVLFYLRNLQKIYTKNCEVFTKIRWSLMKNFCCMKIGSVSL